MRMFLCFVSTTNTAYVGKRVKSVSVREKKSIKHALSYIDSQDMAKSIGKKQVFYSIYFELT